MESLEELQQEIRSQFPDLSAKADREYKRYWGSSLDDDAYSWLQSLANALNAEMLRPLPYESHAAVFAYLANALSGCSATVQKGIDVSFTENLFWQVPPAKAEPYWQELPPALKELYVGFHHRTPIG